MPTTKELTKKDIKHRNKSDRVRLTDISYDDIVECARALSEPLHILNKKDLSKTNKFLMKHKCGVTIEFIQELQCQLMSFKYGYSYNEAMMFIVQMIETDSMFIGKSIM